MRTRIVFLVSGIVLLGFGSFGQQVILKKKNLIKFNFSGLAVNSYTLQYERVLGAHSSLALTLSTSPNVPLPFKSTLMNDFGGNS